LHRTRPLSLITYDLHSTEQQHTVLCNWDQYCITCRAGHYCVGPNHHSH